NAATLPLHFGVTQPGCRRTDRPVPRHPARLAVESTAGLLARGSLPVTAFPGFPVALWHRLAPYRFGGSRGLGTFLPPPLPPWPCAESPSRVPLSGEPRALVNPP